MFKRKKKSPSAKDISAMTKKSEKTNVSSQSYSSLPKSIYSGKQECKTSTPSRSISGSGTLNLVSSSSQEIHPHSPHSPLDLPMETLQSISDAYNLGKGLNADNSSTATKLQGRSPYQSPVHSSISSSQANSKPSTRHRSLEKNEFSGLFSGESSLERQFERLQMLLPSSDQHHAEINTSNTMPVSKGERRTASMNYREQSQEREQYPHMGARSLEREHLYHVNNRSRSRERPEFTSQLQQTQEQFRNLSRDSLILELQSQITDLNKECAKMQQDLDSTKDKLSSTMNSIKTFWSPELKKERSLRKEESAKYSLLNEQYKATNAELKKYASNIRELESKIPSGNEFYSSVLKDEHESLKQSHEGQTKEVKILRKSVDEMELRLETQKQTLAARDESIKKLLEMLQSKGVAADTIEESQRELEKCRVQKVEHLLKLEELRRDMGKRDNEVGQHIETNKKLLEQLEQCQLQLKQQPASTHTMQAIMEAKDSRISALEKELESLENKLHRLGEEGRQDKETSLKKEMLPNKEKALKSEIENLKTDVSTRDNEIIGLKMKVDTLTNQECEHQHYINVLKDQIKSKEQQLCMFNADIDDLRERLKEKDNLIDKKAVHAQTLSVDKRKVELECAELKDNLNIKERKVNVLQRKVGNLEDLLAEKEDQLTQVKTQSSNCIESSDSAILAMEESNLEKDKQIERLKEERDLLELEHQQECERLETNKQKMKLELDTLQLDVTDKQTELCELREEVSELKASRFKVETRLRQLELSICDKDSEISRCNQKLDEFKVSKTASKVEATEEQLANLSMTIEQCKTEMKSAQSEVDRLLEILKETENEKNEKENQIKELQDTVSQYKQKFGTLKRQHQKDKQKNAHLLEEARRREEDIGTDAEHLKGSMKEKEGRIEELEEALRESVKITAEREMLLMEQKMQIDSSQSEIEELQADLEKAKASTREYTNKLSSYVKQLEDKDVKLKKLNAERHKHMEEVFEMKQEALQSTITQIDSNIGMLEMTSTRKQNNIQEIDELSHKKDELKQQLKKLIQDRDRYLHERSRGKRSKSRTSDPEPIKVDENKAIDSTTLEHTEKDTHNSEVTRQLENVDLS